MATNVVFYDVEIPKGFQLNPISEQAVYDVELPEGFEVESMPQEPIRRQKDLSFVENVAKIFDWASTNLPAAFQENIEQNEIARLRTLEGISGLHPHEQQRLQELKNMPKLNYGLRDVEFTGLESFSDWFIQGAKKNFVYAAKNAYTIFEIVGAGLAGGATGATIGAGIGIAGGPAAPVTVPIGAAQGYTWGRRAGAGAKVFELENGSMRDELLEINEELIKKGLEPRSDFEINIASGVVGTANAALEFIGFQKIAKTFPGGRELIGKWNKGIVNEIFTNKKILGILRDYASAIGTEITTEMLQEVTQLAVSEYFRTNSGLEETPWADRLKRVYQAGVQAFGATVIIGGVGSTARTTTILVQQGVEKAQAKKIAESMTLDEQTEFIGDNFNILMNTVLDMPEIEQMERVESVREQTYDLMVSAKISEEQADATSRFIADRAAWVEKNTSITATEWLENSGLGFETQEQVGTVLPDSSAVGEVVSDVGAAPRETALSLFQIEQTQEGFLRDKEDEAFRILSTATGRPVSWLRTQLKGGEGTGMAARREAISNLVESTQDELALSSLTDLSHYDITGIEELGAGKELAQRALSDIVNRNFYKVEGLNEVIQQADVRYTELVEGIKNNPAQFEENLQNIYNELDSITFNLPQEMQEQYVARLTDDIQNIYNVDRLREAAAQAIGTKQGRVLGQFVEYKSGEKIIKVMQEGNRSTILHELAHFFLVDLIAMSKTEEKAAEQLRQVNEWLGYNGTEYTEAQHEKFARGFEAYVWIGKAPNPTLKRAFDQFKDWVRNVYDSLSDIFNGSDMDFGQDAMNLYENLFADVAIEDKRREIKKVVKEMYKDTPDQIKAVEQQMQEVSFDILSKVLNIPYKNIRAMLTGKRQEQGRENVSRVISNLDRINALQMYPDWVEFYKDHNVSTVEDSRALARLAYENIVEGTYDLDTVDFTSIDVIANLNDTRYNYLLKRFENASTKENRTTTFAAMQDFIDNHIAEEHQQFYQERFDMDMADIQHIENVKDFHGVKEVLLKNADMLLNEQKQAEFKRLIDNAFRGLNFLTPSERRNLFNRVVAVKDISQLKNEIERAFQYADTLNGKIEKRRLDQKIQKSLEMTKNVKRGPREVGKYDYQTNVTFQELRDLNRLSRKEALIKHDGINLFKTEEENFTFQEKLRNKFLSYKSTTLNEISTDLLSSLYKDIQDLKRIGNEAKSEQQHDNKMNKWWKREQLLNILDKKEGSHIFKGGYVKLFGNWESTLNALFDKKTMDEYSLLLPEDDANIFSHQEHRKVIRDGAEIYGIKIQDFDKKIIDMLVRNYRFNETDGRVIREKKYNKMNIIQAYIWNKNDIMRQRLINQFLGEETLISMFSNLTVEDVKFADMLQLAAERYYDQANRVFIKKYGIEMPRVQNYFPSAAEFVSEVDLLSDYAQKSTAPTFTKMRSQNTDIQLKVHETNPVKALFTHIDKMSQYINTADKLDTINSVFKHPHMKEAIKEKYGENTYNALLQIIANSTYTQKGLIYNGWMGFINNLVTNWGLTKLTKPSITFKQVLSATNYAENMPWLQWSTGFIKAWANPKETVDYMMKIPGMRARFEGGTLNEFLKEAVISARFSKTKGMKDAFGMFTKWGDMGALIFGGKPYIDYLINEKGMSEKQAWDEFRKSTYRTQQAGTPSSLSNLQNALKGNPYLRIFLMFRNQQNQYMRKVVDSVIDYQNGVIDKQQLAKTLFMYTFFNQFLYETATSASIVTLALTGDPEDLIADFWKSLFEMNKDALVGLDIVYKKAMDILIQKVITGEEKVKFDDRVGMPLYEDVMNAFKIINKEDPEWEDWHKAMSPLADSVTGLPFTTLINVGGSIGDLSQGDIGKAGLRFFGYTKKRAERILGER